jgi:hypothetical protein
MLVDSLIIISAVCLKNNLYDAGTRVGALEEAKEMSEKNFSNGPT